MDDLKRRAQMAYERGRVSLGLRRMALVLPFVAIATALGEPWRELPIGVGLALFVGASAWYGRTPGRSVFPGLTAGSIAFAAPLLARVSGVLSIGCGATTSCLAITIAGGVGAGVLLALVSKGRLTELVPALAIVSGLAALTCLPLGGAALLAAGSAAVISAPIVRLVRPVTA